MSNELDRPIACIRCGAVPDDAVVEMVTSTRAVWTCQCGMEMVAFGEEDQ